MRFVNAVADEVAKEHPDVLVATNAYLYSRKPPETVKPRPDVRIQPCGFAMWSRIAGLDPMDALVRPGTAQGGAFREIVEANAAYFHSRVYFSDGSRMPTCEP